VEAGYGKNFKITVAEVSPNEIDGVANKNSHTNFLEEGKKGTKKSLRNAPGMKTIWSAESVTSSSRERKLLAR